MEKQQKAPKLKRETAGRYRTDDNRFLVQQMSGPWWVTDTDQTDGFGQPTLHGPFASLSEASDAIRTMSAPPPAPKRRRKPAKG